MLGRTAPTKLRNILVVTWIAFRAQNYINKKKQPMSIGQVPKDSTCPYKFHQKVIISSITFHNHHSLFLLLFLQNSNHEVTYFPRPKVERHLRDIIRPEISNQYYFVFGEVGVGKTRLITEVVRNAICQYGTLGLGAPIYVMTTQVSRRMLNDLDF